MKTTPCRNTLDIALDVLRCYALAQDAERWITVKPNGEQNKGRPVLIEGETGEIKAGMGGKFTGKKLSELPQSKNPHPITEAKWQARQKRLAEKQAAPQNQQPEQPQPVPVPVQQTQQPTQSMAGTPKQVEWAEKIKKEKLDLDTNSLKLQIMSMAKADPAKMDKLRAMGKMSNEQVDAIVDAVKDKDAAWWIENRNTPKEALVVNAWFDSIGDEANQATRPTTSATATGREQARTFLDKYPGQVVLVGGKVLSGRITPEMRKELAPFEKELIAELQERKRARQISQIPTRDPVPTPAQPTKTAPPVRRSEDIPGMGEIRRAQREYVEREDALRRGMEREDGLRIRQEPLQDIETLYAQYPQAAAYIKAEKEAERSNPDNAAIGRRAMEKVLAGKWEEALADMEREKKALNERHMWDSALGADTVSRPIAMDFDLAMDADNPANYPEMRGASGGHLALDRSSVRSTDENGFLRVANSHITKAAVNPYYGREIPGWREAGLEPDKIYQGFRDPEELKKSVPTWAGLPLHIEHHIDSAEDPQKLTRVGTVGTEIRWNEPYIDAPLTIWDQTAIDGIEDGSFRELSCAYRYEPDFTPGTWNGKRYDFVMRNIRGNHVALVEEGRAGSDVLVADAKPAALRRRNVLDVALDVLRGYALAMDEERWITVKPNGEEGKGRPVLIEGSTGEIKAGMGGKFNGRSIDDVPRGKNPHPVTEAKYQARQKRLAEKQTAQTATGAETTEAGKTKASATGGRTGEVFKASGKTQIEVGEKGGQLVEANKVPLKTYRKDPGNLAVAIGYAGTISTQLNEPMFVFSGNSNGHAIWAVKKPGEFSVLEENSMKPQGFIIYPDGEVYKTKQSGTGQTGTQRERKSQGPAPSQQQAGGGNATKQTPTNARFVENMNAAQLEDEIRKKQDAIARAQGRMNQNSESAEAKARMEAFPLGAGGSGWTAVRKRQDDRRIQQETERSKRFTEAYGQKQNLEKELEVLQKARQEVGETGKTQKQLKQQDERQTKSTKTERKWTQTQKAQREGSSYSPKIISSGDYEIHGGSGLYRVFHKGEQVGQTDSLSKAKGFVDWHEQKNSVYQAQLQRGKGKDSALDGAIGGQKHKKREGLMSRFMKWFRGAQDGDPAIEKKEVDLAQAIIDLHRKDPVTGEIRDDVSEDADKAAEVRVLVERLKGKIPPEDYERLFGAIAALAAEEEAQDEEGGQLMFEETKGREDEGRENIHADAMRAAGCDAEDPDEARAFAGGVKYGEELERNPAEREKLDREHESEGMRRAMDACGVDAENPSETKAFAEGVKYGEENARQKAEDEDPEDEDKLAGDEDKNAMIDKILAAVPDLTDEQKKKIADTLSDLAYSPATGDEELEKRVEGAADRAFRKRRFLGATDAARIRAQATSDAMARMRDIAEACRVVRPLVGEMDSLAFDSANDVYGYTLEQMGKRPRKYDRRAWRGMVEMLLDNHAALATDAALRAREAKRIPDAGPFRYLKNITVG